MSLAKTGETLQLRLGTTSEVQCLRKKETFVKGGRGGLEAMSYFFTSLGDVDFF